MERKKALKLPPSSGPRKRHGGDSRLAEGETLAILQKGPIAEIRDFERVDQRKRRGREFLEHNFREKEGSGGIGRKADQGICNVDYEKKEGYGDRKRKRVGRGGERHLFSGPEHQQGNHKETAREGGEKGDLP